MNKQPKLLDVSLMRDIFKNNFSQICQNLFFNDELAMIHGEPSFFQFIMQQQPPFVINDHRLGIITHGEGHINFNLMDRHLSAGTLIYLGPGTIIDPIHFSDDLELMGIGLFADFPMPFAAGQFPSAFNGQVRDFQLPVSVEDQQTARNILETLWHLVHQKDYHRPTVSSLVAALMHHYDRLFHQQADTLAATRSREQSTRSAITPIGYASPSATLAPSFARPAAPLPRSGSTALSLLSLRCSSATATSQSLKSLKTSTSPIPPSSPNTSSASPP